MRCARPDRVCGFTLIEMLIAIAIFGIIATAGYRVLDTVLVTRDRVTQEYRRWRDIARALASIERDMQAAKARPVRSATDEKVAALTGVEAPAQADQPLVSFTRGGGLDAAGLAAPPRRIGYRVRDGAIERLAWPAPDQAPRSQPAVAVILRGVAALDLRYRDAGGAWRTRWPAAEMRLGAEGRAVHAAASAADAPLPTAVEVAIRLAGGERIHRLIPLPAGGRS
jgi:general secretion pathway protein J